MNTQQLEWVKDNFKVNTENIYTLEDIETEFAKINFNHFRAFYKEHTNYAGSEYLTGLNKLLFFTKLYKQHNINIDVAGIGFIDRLCEKVKQVASTVEDKYLTPQQFARLGIETPFFMPNECEAIERLGGLQNCARLLRSTSGENGLALRMIEMSKDKQIALMSSPKFEPISQKVLMVIGQGKQDI